MKRLVLTNSSGARMPVPERLLAEALALWQNRIAIANFSVALEVTTDAQIKRLNARYRKKKQTNRCVELSAV
jgi:ssRNA-specific RNase YbeY (16S rRNA maturation enzyme)